MTDREALTKIISNVTDRWDEPLDGVHDVPQIVNAVLASGWLAQVRADALRAAAERWKPYIYERRGGVGPASIQVTKVRFCPTCEGRDRETTGLVCQTCGHDYGGRRA